MGKPLKIIIVAIGVFGTGLFTFWLLAFWGETDLFETESLLSKVVRIGNESYPRMVDSTTRIGSITFHPKDSVRYHVTLLPKREDNFNIDLFNKETHFLILKEVKERQEFQFLKGEKAYIIHRFRFENEKHFTDVVISPEEYKFIPGPVVPD